MKLKAKVTSGDIKQLLAVKHAKDVLVTECKNGQSWGSHLLKLDAWALRRSWAPLTTIGYEIKVSRQDFEQDQKWINYVDYSHEFYFICPAGLIHAIDLPQGIGLIWTTMSGSTLQTKIKATRRKPDSDKLNMLMTYIIMARSVIVKDMYEANKGEGDKADNRLKEIRDAVAFAGARKELAFFVKAHVQESFRKMRERCDEAERQEQRVKDFEERLALLGIAWNPKEYGWHKDQQVRNEIDLLGSRINSETLSYMKRLARELNETTEAIEKQRQEINSRLAVQACATNQNRT